MEETVTLYRPTGPEEIDLVKQTGYRRWPPRLPDQPIFCPVTNELYAVEIARDWNVRASGYGCVTRFAVRKSFMDRYDQQILEVLQQDGRINNQDLADRIGLSPSPCLRRVRALEESGLIAGYRAVLDAKKLGLTLMALIHVSMDVHTPARFANFEAVVKLLPEVLECLLITGQDADYQLKVAVRDMDHYQSLLLTRLSGIEGVTGVHSSFVLRQVLVKTALDVTTRAP